MKKGYIVARVQIHDPEGFKTYLDIGLPSLDRFGGRSLVLGGQYTTFEGQERERHVVIEFDSYQTALDCYNSPEYQAAAEIRKRYAETDLVVVEGT
ncbi:DUF1330 domain-containing protein [Roseibium polysiphoniae]|uniref:DUF1330 domain-containing protein n=1 Tax=Roseibium polysiphoniae TaxID=2571221 RepID=A0A944CFT0_9HYPH|nr:DUF1330 domain-containing protein [Roseibium polysiphoniae]MBS8261680.1 DUF1330 domain-containing protein [Roseibium polysiphoniae]